MKEKGESLVERERVIKDRKRQIQKQTQMRANFHYFFSEENLEIDLKIKYMCIESTRKIFIMEHMLRYSF